jgi:hypothetical protein
VRTITPELTALLRSRFQAAGSGYRGRLEVDEYVADLPIPTTNFLFSFVTTRSDGDPGIRPPTGWTHMGRTTDGASLSIDGLAAAYRVPVTISSESMTFSWPGSAGYGGSSHPRGFGVEFAGVTGGPEDIHVLGGQSGLPLISPAVTASGRGYVVAGFSTRNGSITGAASGTTMLDSGDGAGQPPYSALVYRYVSSAGSYTVGVTVGSGFDSDQWGCIAFFVASAVDDVIQHVTAATSGGGVILTWDTQPTITDVGAVGDAGYVTHSYRPTRINLNRNLRMGPDQGEIELANEELALGWGPTSIFPTNSRCRVYQWFGDVANEVLTFTGVIDKIGDSRDPLTTALSCRSMAGPILVDQTFSTTGPQGTDEDGHVRTEDNGVYVNREVDYIASDILDRAGWPSDLIDVADTSFVLDEFLIEDGATWWDTLARLAGFVGYDLWDDEDGVIHLKPLGSAAGVDDALTADYAYEIGIA